MQYPTLMSVGAGIALTMLTGIAYGDGESEATSFGVANYNGSGECPCTGTDGKKCSDSSWFTTFATTFNNVMTLHSFSQTQLNTNKGVDHRDFLDKDAGGADDVDPWGTDFADVIFHSSHGWRDCSTNRFGFVLGEEETDPADCNATSDQIRWGNTDAEVAIVFNCHSTQECVWDSGTHRNMSTGGFNTILGFHGYMWLASKTNVRLNSYLLGAKYNGLGDDWVDDLTIRSSEWSNPDQCATAVIVASSEADADSQYYNGGFHDRKSTGTGSSYYYYVDGCDPEGGEEL